MDKYIESFLSEFGAPQSARTPQPEHVESYRKKLPETLLAYWQAFGFSSFMDGLFWITDPGEYKGVLKAWLNNTPLIDDIERLHVIARNGFGDLYLWHENKGNNYEISAMHGWIISLEANEEDLEKSLQLFFASKSPYSVDIEDEETGDELYESAAEEFGALAESEIFGFIPSLVAGGQMTREHLRKIDLYVHMDQIIQLQTPRVLNSEELEQLAF